MAVLERRTDSTGRQYYFYQSLIKPQSSSLCCICIRRHCSGLRDRYDMALRVLDEYRGAVRCVSLYIHASLNPLLVSAYPYVAVQDRGEKTMLSALDSPMTCRAVTVRRPLSLVDNLVFSSISMDKSSVQFGRTW